MSYTHTHIHVKIHFSATLIKITFILSPHRRSAIHENHPHQQQHPCDFPFIHTHTDSKHNDNIYVFPDAQHAVLACAFVLSIRSFITYTTLSPALPPLVLIHLSPPLPPCLYTYLFSVAVNVVYIYYIVFTNATITLSAVASPCTVSTRIYMYVILTLCGQEGCIHVPADVLDCLRIHNNHLRNHKLRAFI